MPFTEPWRNYLSGDFFYGFSGARAKLIKQLTNGKSTGDIAKAGNVAWLDQLLTGTAVSAAPTLNDDFARFCRSNPKWKEVVQPGKPLETAAENTPMSENDNRRWRRKSKAGIAFLTKFHHNIHFAIDADIDWTAVVSKPESYEQTAVPFRTDSNWQYKVTDGSNDEHKYRIITYAELRFIYRNRDDSDFQKRIQFWYAEPSGTFKPGPPPWQRDPATWKSYVPSAQDE